MRDPFELTAKLREKYPDDVAEIEKDEKRLSNLMRMQAYAEHEVTQELLAVARKEVINARSRLATDRTLLEDEQAQRELWTIIDSRMWFIRLVGKDFQGEMKLVEQMLQAELSK